MMGYLLAGYLRIILKILKELLTKYAYIIALFPKLRFLKYIILQHLISEEDYTLQHEELSGDPSADLIVRYGDINNLGFGWRYPDSHRSHGRFNYNYDFRC